MVEMPEEGKERLLKKEEEVKGFIERETGDTGGCIPRNLKRKSEDFMVFVKPLSYPQAGAKIMDFLFERQEVFAYELLRLIFLQKSIVNYGDAQIITFTTLTQLVNQGFIDKIGEFDAGIGGYTGPKEPKYKITEKGRVFVGEEKRKAEEERRTVKTNKVK